jgi:hypothetical protein
MFIQRVFVDNSKYSLKIKTTCKQLVIAVTGMARLQNAISVKIHNFASAFKLFYADKIIKPLKLVH